MGNSGMPLAQAQENGNPPDEGQTMELYTRLQGMKVILIEDDQWIQNGLRMFFQYNGCHLEGYGNATLAMEAMTKEKFDIIISDYWLPDLDGLTLFSRVHQLQPDAIRILITAYPTAGLQEEASRMGIHDFLPKPLTIPKLEKSLEMLIERSSTAVGGRI
jgi:DNA-binding NtrC family response regulator